MPDSTQLPEAVRDFQLETEFPNDHTTIHTTRWNRVNSSPCAEWERTKFLGHGGYGLVWLQQNKGTKELRAVKQMKQNRDADYIRELEALAKFSQKKYAGFFVKTYGWYYQGSDWLFIAMEYCKHGSLEDYLKIHRTLPELQARRIAKQVLAGLDCMHEEGFAHRDLKPANILIWECPPNRPWWVKICDLGLTKRVESGSGSTAVRGTEGFMPPELIGFGADPRRADPFSADMWCFGETVFRVLTGQRTFRDDEALRKYQLHETGFPVQTLRLAEASDTAARFLSSVMKQRPGARLTAPQALEHEWLMSQDPQSEVDSTSPNFNIEFEVPIFQIPTLGIEASAQWSTKPQDYGSADDPPCVTTTQQFPLSKLDGYLQPVEHSGIGSLSSDTTHSSEGGVLSTELIQAYNTGVEQGRKDDTNKGTDKSIRDRLNIFRFDIFSKDQKTNRRMSLARKPPRQSSPESSPIRTDIISYNDLPSKILHCGNFPDGTIFFYARDCIYLYLDLGNGAKFCPINSSTSNWSQTVRPSSRSCSNDAIFLALDSNSIFRGAIHTINIEQAPQIRKQRVDFEPMSTAVEKVAFSPDGSMIAVACEPDDTTEAQARIRLYQLQERRESSGSALSSTSQQSNRLVAQKSLLGDAGRIQGVKDSRDLFFSHDGQTLYHVCVLKNDPRNWKARVQVNIFKTSTRDPLTAGPDWTFTIEDTNSEFRRFFMQGMVPLHTKTGFMCITHEDSIIRQALHEGGLRGMTIPIQGVFGIRSLLLSSDDQKAVLLATPNGADLEVHGGFIKNLQTPKKLTFPTKIKYNPEVDNAYIREDNEGMEVVITSRNSKRTYIVDVRGLFEAQ